jgi:hypothetical protein
MATIIDCCKKFILMFDKCFLYTDVAVKTR